MTRGDPTWPNSSPTPPANGGEEGTGFTGADADETPRSSQQTMDDFRQQVASAADAQKNRAAEGLGDIADVAQQTGEELRAENETLASWVNVASDQLRHMGRPPP